MINDLKKITLESIIIKFISAICFVSSFFYIFSYGNFGQLSYISNMNVLLYTSILFSFFILLAMLSYIFKTPIIDYYTLFITSFIYACMTLVFHNEFYYSLGVILMMVMLIYYLMKDDKLKLHKIKINKFYMLLIISVFALFMFTFIGLLTTLRYLSYNNSTYDFGIFSQMFYYMKNTLLPMVTCERDKLLSHFAVHISPIFYLILPVYMIFPSPITLQIMQALIVSSGVIPLYLLAKHYKLSNKMIIAISIAYCTYPALVGGTFYDIHENKFLTALILWFFYFFEKKKTIFVYIFAFLILFVKEDAALYVSLISLYTIIGRRYFKHGIIIFLISIAYFVFALFMLKIFGQGAMIGRYDNFIVDPELGLLGIFKTIFLNPAYLFYQVFTIDKIRFMILTLLPLGFLPLLNKKYSQFILLVPYLVMNLMPNYVYQHSIDFQYTYGVSGIFFYLVVINLSQITYNLRKFITPIFVVSSILLFLMTMSWKLDYIKIYRDNYDINEQISEALTIIPDDASVEASGYFVPKLSSRDILYNQPSKQMYETDYVVLDLRPDREKNMEIAIELYKSHGYVIEIEIEEVMVILKKIE